MGKAVRLLKEGCKFMLSKEDLEVESIVKEEEQVKQCEYCGSTEDLVKVFGVYLCKPCRKKYRDGELRSK